MPRIWQKRDSSEISLNSILINVIFMLGMIIFFCGFFPMDYNEFDRATRKDIPSTVGTVSINSTMYYKKRLSKLILMIIDAMRYNFISSNNLKFIRHSIGTNNANLLKLKVDMPTVTMPRIKTLTTGTISNFIDVVLNLGSTELQSDSIIYQAENNHEKIVFYGDNTWVKLFPRSFHRKMENTDSFFVQDFYEGDKNITKHLSSEFNNTDWDLLILHYLGLDHIGHVEGAFSDKIQKKLFEMDEVAQQIYSDLKNMCKNLTNAPCVFLITADHGMRDAGGHGGSSLNEIYVPLIVFPTVVKLNKIDDVGANEKREIYEQIDLVPTLSVMLGLPIPSTNIGCIIPELINFLPLEDQLFAFYYNTKQLIEKATKKFDSNNKLLEEYNSWYISAMDLHQAYLKSIGNPSSVLGDMNAYNAACDIYVRTSREISKLISSSYTRFNMFAVVVGILITTLSTCILFITVLLTPNFLSLAFECGNFFTVAVISFLTGSLITYSPLPLLSSIHLNSLYFFVIFVLLLIIMRISKSRKQLNFNYKFPAWILILKILYTISLSSSSFIEEEHQTWYFFGTTSVVYLLLKTTISNDCREFVKNTPKYDNYSMLVRFLKRLLLNDEKNTCAKNKLGRNMQFSKIYWILIAFMHIFARRLNQTGDKWLSTPDIGDWFAMKENKLWLSLLLFAVLISVMLILQKRNDFNTNCLMCVGLVLIYAYKAISGSVLLLTNVHKSRLRFVVILFWTDMGAIFILNYAVGLLNTFSRYQQKLCIFSDLKRILHANFTIFTLISLFLHKSHNTILVPVQILTLTMTFSLCSSSTRSTTNCDDDENKAGIIPKIILSYWIGKMFFFYQGNSNSLASIDLNPGYIGLESYNVFLVGVMITLNTYSGPLCSMVMLFNEILANDDHRRKENISWMFLLTSLLVLLPTTAYLFVMVIFRFHLFVWSVFSPKLLYEAYQALLYTVILIVSFIYLKVFRIF